MIFAIMTSGYIANALGWEAIFYLIGGCGCVWFILWAYLVHDTPADHPTISKIRQMFYALKLLQQIFNHKTGT